MILLPLILLWVRRPLEFAMGIRWCLLLVFTGVLVLSAPEGLGIDPSNDRTGVQGNTGQGIQKHREGTRVANMIGNFREIAHRWTFTSDSGELSIRVLENQSLERIVKAIKEDPHDQRWKISGELTEFYDENFLLIRRIERAASTEF